MVVVVSFVSRLDVGASPRRKPLLVERLRAIGESLMSKAKRQQFAVNSRRCHVKDCSVLITVLLLSAFAASSFAQEAPLPNRTAAPLNDPFHPKPAEVANIARHIDDRLLCTISPLLNGKVLIAGGIRAERGGGAIFGSNLGSYNGHVVYLSSAELYDPSNSGFRFTGSMSTGRVDAAAALLPSGDVLVVGGENWTGTYERYALRSAEIYDPRTNEFTQTVGMSSAREAPVAVALKNGTVLVAGGFGRNEQGLPNGGVIQAEIYDAASGSFKATGSMTTVRSMYCQGCRPAASILSDGRVLFAGGIEDDGTILKSAELYDPVTGAFTRTGDMKAARLSATATLLEDGKVLIEDGVYHGLYGKGLVHPQFVESAMAKEVYNPRTGTFSLVKPR
jgi:hypothetical protein